ncbi:hypothetical protein PAXRUDRAFT_16347 [Paxillus rubicundulus Ve08.2h10]|uniref:Unplaced genomic scaffold scaffold_1467, whole genome shotgun sequence n=1 Tax=Paxillus rubicundulus Ve08.2h10 TaxID=930991 RepID=A0A0D0DM20_9AGAM|nr:hypothetical protein PAXRUDRAFT_16347 [Paxillus rubicundulus Ve08.2h10]
MGAIIRPISTPTALLNPHTFSDASSGFGIGIIIGTKWRAWRLQADWSTHHGKKDIRWAEATSSYTETTPAWLMVGKSADTATKWSIPFSRVSTFSLNQPIISYPSYHTASPVRKTLQTPHPEESTALPTSSFLPWTSLSMLESFSSMPLPPYQLGNSESYEKQEAECAQAEAQLEDELIICILQDD